MKIYKKESVQHKRKFRRIFFLIQKNLQKITPEEMGFEITDLTIIDVCWTNHTIQGVSAFSLKLSWVSEITFVKEKIILSMNNFWAVCFVASQLTF
jgi:hypothetical protein